MGKPCNGWVVSYFKVNPGKGCCIATLLQESPTQAHTMRPHVKECSTTAEDCDYRKWWVGPPVLQPWLRSIDMACQFRQESVVLHSSSCKPCSCSFICPFLPSHSIWPFSFAPSLLAFLPLKARNAFTVGLFHSCWRNVATSSHFWVISSLNITISFGIIRALWIFYAVIGNVG